MKSNIIRTLSYAQVFEFPLTLKELQQRLIGKKTSLRSLESQVSLLKIKSHKDYYFLADKSGVKKRVRNKKHLIEKIASGHKIARMLKAFPTIKAVLVTGAIAAKNPGADDDIDFLIITKPQTLWITRLLVNTFLDILHIRRTPISKNPSDKACLNLWLTTSTMSLPEEKRGLYAAYEIALCMLMWDRDGTFQEFLHQNKWVSEYLPNTLIETRSQKIRKQNTILSALDSLAYRLQSWYMRSKKTKETITKESAFFHPRNTRGIIESKYEKIYKKYSKIYLS